jgi:hypothetical protein
VAGPRKKKPVSLACREALKKIPAEILPEGGATPERLQQAGVTIAMTIAGRKIQVIGNYYLAGLSGFPAANDLNGAGGGHPSSRTPITEIMESNRRALRLAEAALHPGDWRVVCDVVCLELDLGAVGQSLGFGKDHAANAVALDRLRRGLRLLAEHWGY